MRSTYQYIIENYINNELRTNGTLHEEVPCIRVDGDNTVKANG